MTDESTDKKVKVGNLGTPLLVILLVIASFLIGSLWTKINYLKKTGTAPASTAPTGQVQGEAFNPSKKDKPEVKFFVMSFCPYGNQAEAGLKPVVDLLGDKVVWEPVYIVSDAKKSCETGCANSVYDENRCNELVKAGRVQDLATCKKYFPYNDKETCLKEKCVDVKEGEFDSLHGVQEKNQDIRELCAWNMGDQKKWWIFVENVNKNCTSQNADTCWEQQAKNANLDTEKIKSCEQNEGNKLLTAQIELADKYNVSGSPTIYINDSLYNGGRQPEDYKKGICAGFNKVPKECDQVLSAATSAAPNAAACN